MVPSKLKAGDEVRVIAPSRSMTKIGEDCRKIATERLEALGLKVTFGKYVNEADEDYLIAQAKHRAEDLNEAFGDKNVKAILTVIGGFNSNQIQEYLKILNEKTDIQADLHNHTKGSDGAQSPLMFLLRASRNGKNIVSMSDHDSVTGYQLLVKQITNILVNLEEINNNPKIEKEEKEKVKIGATRLLKKLEEIKILPAVEMITTYRGNVIEIFGYNLDVDILENEMQ